MANPAPHDDEDLLAPSLTAHDDAVGFDRPWNPSLLVVIGAFFGLVPMGLLLAENFKRLGKPGAFAPTLAFTLVVGLALTALAGYAWAFGIAGVYEAGNRDHRRMFRLAMQVAAVAVGLVILQRQRPRWDIHVGHGGEGGPLLWPALGAIGGAFLLQFLVAAPFAMTKAGG